MDGRAAYAALVGDSGQEVEVMLAFTEQTDGRRLRPEGDLSECFIERRRIRIDAGVGDVPQELRNAGKRNRPRRASLCQALNELVRLAVTLGLAPVGVDEQVRVERDQPPAPRTRCLIDIQSSGSTPGAPPPPPRKLPSRSLNPLFCCSRSLITCRSPSSTSERSVVPSRAA